MARDITPAKYAKLDANATRPIYLVQLGHSGSTEYLSCSGSITFDSQAYTAGGINLNKIEDAKTAQLSFPATSTRITQVQNGVWRGGVCNIYMIPATEADGSTFTASDGELIFYGTIESSALRGENILITATNAYFNGALTPRFQFNDVSSLVPAVGQTTTFDGERYSYEQWLKTVAAIQQITRPGVTPTVKGRQSSAQLNSFQPQEDSGYKLITAQGVHIPIVYGRDSVKGFVMADTTFGSAKVIAVGWCLGEVYDIEKIYINDAELPASGVTVRHYRGSTTQAVDPILKALTSTSPEFDEDFVIRTPTGNVGVAWSLITIAPSSGITAPFSFRAIVKGTLVTDPDGDGTANPYADLEQFSYDFDTSLTDSSTYARTLTPSSPGGLASPANGITGQASFTSSPVISFGTSKMTLEVNFDWPDAGSSPETSYTLIDNTGGSPEQKSLRVVLSGSSVLVYLSSNGTSWDIANGEDAGTVTNTSPLTTQRLTVEHVENSWVMALNGNAATLVTTPTTSPETVNGLADSAAQWLIGDAGITVHQARLTVGAARYGGSHNITATPFSDSNNYSANTVYSNKPALCWNDLATNAVYGAGATGLGISECVSYGDGALASGAARCRIGLTIQDVKRTEEWLDTLATYANCIWFPEGSSLRLRPDRAAGAYNGSGPELVTNTSSIPSPLESITTVDGATYVVSVSLDTASTTSPLTGISVEFGGTEVIATQTAVGLYSATVVASGTSNTIEVVEQAGFNGTWSGLSVRRDKAQVTNWIQSSLSIEPVNDSESPNSVLVRYKVPDETSGAWKTATFGVMTADAALGEAVRQTVLELPGVYRIEEASNKALRHLYQRASRARFSFTDVDTGLIRQEGDTLHLVRSTRGVDKDLWVESSTLIDYGRYLVECSEYSDNNATDEDYTEVDLIGSFYNVGQGGAGDDYGYAVVVNSYASIAPCQVSSAYAIAVSDVVHYPLTDIMTAQWNEDNSIFPTTLSEQVILNPSATSPNADFNYFSIVSKPNNPLNVCFENAYGLRVIDSVGDEYIELLPSGSVGLVLANTASGDFLIRGVHPTGGSIGIELSGGNWVVSSGVAVTYTSGPKADDSGTTTYGNDELFPISVQVYVADKFFTGSPSNTQLKLGIIATSPRFGTVAAEWTNYNPFSGITGDTMEYRIYGNTSVVSVTGGDGFDTSAWLAAIQESVDAHS